MLHGLVSMILFTLGGPSPVEMTVSLGPGDTRLGEIGIYRVAYQSYGHEVHEMPPSWSGHFEETSGISYVPVERIQGREAILLHSPWHVPPGKVWVEYRLRLPKVQPILLSFGIAMRDDVAVPGKSDGVTFSCSLVEGDQSRELMREHQDKAQWKDYRFDLSDLAGKEVLLRLQTEPGPANSPSWDYSYFGDAKICCGKEGESIAARLQRITSSKAYRALEKAELGPLCNAPKQGIVPSNLLPHENAMSTADSETRFTYKGKDCTIIYAYRPETGALDDLSVQVDDGPAFQPCAAGGIFAIAKEGKGARIEKGKLVQLTPNPKDLSLSAVWTYPVGSDTLRVEWVFSIRGKSLVIQSKSDQPLISGFSLGREGSIPLKTVLPVPYLLGSLSYLPQQGLYSCRYLDWTQSHASSCPQGEAVYEAKTDGSRNPLFEEGTIAVSPCVDEVLPNIPHPASPYIELLGPRIMLDIWGHHDGTYGGDAANLRDLKDNGVDQVAIISHVWQRYGYDVKLPDHLPANPDFGGDDGMIEFGRAANECGYVWSLHENYIDLYPDAPSYDPSARVMRADGAPSLAWFNAGTGVQSFGLKCNRALGFAQANAPEIHRRFQTKAAYLDVHTCVPPWHQLDHEASQPMAGMALAKVKYDSELFAFMRRTHEGPLFGEGYNHFFWAGLCDGVEAQVSGGEDHSPFLNFDLLKLHPQMVNHGMGYYERWFRQGYEHRWGQETGTVEQIDKYRAQELAYGHAGFVGAAQVDNVQWVAKEHHLMTPIQKLTGASRPAEIFYEVEGRLVTASAALAVRDTRRQRIRYDSGLTLWVNWREDPWTVEGRILHQWGFLALGPGTEVSTSLRDGQIADIADCPEYVFVDARTGFNMPYLKSEKDIEPRLSEFKPLGGNRIALTYEWLVSEPFGEDVHCFVHFTSPGSDHPERIVFQQDHDAPKPTSQWRKGDVIKDGPYEIEVPEDKFDDYDIAIGLHKGARVPLKGIPGGADKIFIGRLHLERQENQVTGVTLADFKESAKAFEQPAADFAAHLNPEGTWVDFGKVATDGSVKIERGPNRLTVLPYPRDKAFSVAMDLKALAEPEQRPNLDAVKVRALAAMTQQDMGVVSHEAREGRLVFQVGLKGAGRYVIEW